MGVMPIAYATVSAMISWRGCAPLQLPRDPIPPRIAAKADLLSSCAVPVATGMMDCRGYPAF